MYIPRNFHVSRDSFPYPFDPAPWAFLWNNVKRKSVQRKDAERGRKGTETYRKRRQDRNRELKERSRKKKGRQKNLRCKESWTGTIENYV